ncbi:YihY/virulence factor BrkB family protein [Microterricola viridarii]|uniref:Membrane protein n=1 Tax=Microterricola viridarii TaxID=412690 RepID=A0A1H1ZB48_9MICO|nr:YihY/virulence factor BrkB family protein [Microterricola viridarii]SDT30948.1 membrane protein [Microterricola viridarii]
MADTSMSSSTQKTPLPDDARKPAWPWHLEPRSWRYALRKTVREFNSDNCPDSAAALTYYAVLAVIPALIALVSILGLLGNGQKFSDMLTSIAEQVAPESAVALLNTILDQASSRQFAGTALIVSIVVGIWSASAYTGAFSRAMNRVYGVAEGRTFIKLKFIQLVVTLIGMLLVVVMTVLVAIGDTTAAAISQYLGLGEQAVLIWSIVKWPLFLVTIILAIALLYYATPNIKQPKFRWISMGALVAVVAIVVMTAGFSFYVANFSSYDRTYGALAGAVIFLVWVWLSNLALLFGAEFDAELERARQLQAGIPAEAGIQLPLRSRKKFVKSNAKEAKDIAEGAGIRVEQNGGKR